MANAPDWNRDEKKARAGTRRPEDVRPLPEPYDAGADLATIRDMGRSGAGLARSLVSNDVENFRQRGLVGGTARAVRDSVEMYVGGGVRAAAGGLAAQGNLRDRILFGEQGVARAEAAQRVAEAPAEAAPTPAPEQDFRAVRSGQTPDLTAPSNGLTRIVKLADGSYTDAAGAQGDVRYYDRTGTRADTNPGAGGIATGAARARTAPAAAPSEALQAPANVHAFDRDWRGHGGANVARNFERDGLRMPEAPVGPAEAQYGPDGDPVIAAMRAAERATAMDMSDPENMRLAAARGQRGLARSEAMLSESAQRTAANQFAALAPEQQAALRTAQIKEQGETARANATLAVQREGQQAPLINALGTQQQRAVENDRYGLERLNDPETRQAEISARLAPLRGLSRAERQAKLADTENVGLQAAVAALEDDLRAGQGFSGGVPVFGTPRQGASFADIDEGVFGLTDRSNTLGGYLSPYALNPALDSGFLKDIADARAYQSQQGRKRDDLRRSESGR